MNGRSPVTALTYIQNMHIYAHICEYMVLYCLIYMFIGHSSGLCKRELNMSPILGYIRCKGCGGVKKRPWVSDPVRTSNYI